MAHAWRKEQFILTKDRSLFLLWLWMAWAMNSLPVPFSPFNKTGFIFFENAFTAFFTSTMDSKHRGSSLGERAGFSSTLDEERFLFRTSSIDWMIRSREKGFSMKSWAPSLVALTAVSMVPCPDIIRTSISG